MASTEDYVALTTSEHRDKPLFTSVIRAFTDAFAANNNMLASLPDTFDLDTAVGDQLDAVAAWVGLSRRVEVPLTGVYFTWDDAALGWESGTWKGATDPSTGLVYLHDDVFRILIRAKIAANNWNGSMEDAATIWALVYNGLQSILIEDQQDMTMVVAFIGPPLSAVNKALLTGGYLPLKQAGVRIRRFMLPPADAPLFTWDVNGAIDVSGWDVGQWPIEIYPT